MKTKLMVLFLAFISINTYAQNTGSLFKNSEIATSYADYLTVKDALIASDYEKTKAMALALQKSLTKIQNGKSIVADAEKIANAATIADQRKFFATLSEGLIPLVRESKNPEATLFLQHCPMANKGEGANWLSNEKEVRNPYFGEKMLTCGSAKELD